MIVPSLVYEDASAAIEWLCMPSKREIYTCKDPEGYVWSFGSYTLFRP